jgi:hypothetical protein
MFGPGVMTSKKAAPANNSKSGIGIMVFLQREGWKCLAVIIPVFTLCEQA